MQLHIRNNYYWNFNICSLFFIEKNVKNMYLRIFILGASIHLFCEFTGINGWYCKNGNACK